MCECAEKVKVVEKPPRKIRRARIIKKRRCRYCHGTLYYDDGAGHYDCVKCKTPQKSL